MTLFRRYLTSHPWITFRADLSKAPVSLWLLLGEARSKCEHVAGVPLPLTVSQELYRMFLAKGVHSTTAIEGNTLSEKDVLQHLAGRLEVPESQEYQVQEVDNLVRAFDEITVEIRRSGPSDQLTPAKIQRWNELILQDLPLAPEVEPGKLRRHEVTVGRYLGAPPEDLGFLLERMCAWLNESEIDVQSDLRLGGVIVRAVLAHLYLAWIHPFGDGNGRTARLVEFFLLVNAGVPDPSAHLLSNYYNKARSLYYQELDYASTSHGDVVRFILYAVRGFVEELREQLATIRDHQWSLAWKDYVATRFLGDDSKNAVRRHALLLGLSERADRVPRDAMGLVDPRVARLYAQVSEKTLDRDLDWLVQEDLVERTAEGFRARREAILAFLPRTWPKTV